MRRFLPVFLLGVFFALLAAAAIPQTLEAPIHEFVSVFIPNEPPQKLATLLMGGDIMLSRQVERIIRAEGSEYPFRYIKELFFEHEYVLINFEGTVPKTHVPTPSMGFSFSVAEDIAGTLARFGVTHAGLANNHAFDFGAEGYKNAQTILGDAHIATFGHPEQVTASDITYIEIGTVTVAVVPVHTVFRRADQEVMRAAFADAATRSDLQIAYVHWGVEYALVHDPLQETMAREWIAAGADAVVGHHPHVVQDIARIDGVPVFYSLGNLLFDQYWDVEVRTGLLLSVSEADGRLHFSLIPVISEEKSVPRLMEDAAKQEFLESLAARSESSLREEIQTGTISTKAVSPLPPWQR